MIADTHINSSVMINEFGFKMMRDSCRVGEFKLRLKLIAENYWTEKCGGKMTGRNDRTRERLYLLRRYNASAVMLGEYVKLKVNVCVFV